VNPRLQRRVQRYGWDKATEIYERHWARPLAPAQMRLVELAGLTSGDRVLDVACGTGLVTFPAAVTVGSDGLVVGTDISGRMVEHVRHEARRRGMLQVEASRMEAEGLRFPDHSFGAVLCAFGLMYVPDPGAALREMFRVTRPGGRVVAAVWGRKECCGWSEMFPIVDAEIAGDVCPLFFDLGTGDSLTRTMLTAGFTDVSVERTNVTLPFGTADHAISAVFSGGPVALPYSRFAEETKHRVHEAYLTSIASYKNGSGYHIPGEFVLAAGRKPPND